MFAAALAAISPFQMVRFSEHNEPFFRDVVIGLIFIGLIICWIHDFFFQTICTGKLAADTCLCEMLIGFPSTTVCH